jgi:hypothetical protein
VARRVADITPLVRGLPSPAKAASTRAHLPPGQRGPPLHIRPSRLVLGNTSRRPRRDKVAALADAVCQPRCSATPSGRSFGRSWPPPAGPGQPSSGPLGLNSSPNLRIKGVCPAAPDVLPAQMPHVAARKAHIAQGYGRRSSHESSHGSQARPAGSVTLSDGDCLRRTRAYPPAFCAGFGSMPITMLAVQFWAFCAPTSRAGTAGLRPGAGGRRSGQSR